MMNAVFPEKNTLFSERAEKNSAPFCFSVLTPRMNKYQIRLFGVAAWDIDIPLLPCRKRRLLPAHPKSVVCCGFPYAIPESHYQTGNLSRYAQVPDYHAALLPVLQALAEDLAQDFPPYVFVPFLDDSPLQERIYALKAGLGVLGDNGLLISHLYGSWIFLGSLVTDMPFSASPPLEKTECIHCGRCRKVCPGGALSPKGFQLERCLSHITQKKGVLTAWEIELLRKTGMVWGCDACQSVCPLNVANVLAVTAATQNENGGPNVLPYAAFDAQKFLPATLTVEQLDQPGLFETSAFAWRGEKVIRRNLELVHSEEKKASL